jgi:homoserine O-succinyltransferase/O-acetyltransferase
MPLVEHIQLPVFRRLREAGQEVLSLNHALRQDIRELHIGLLNMMPDAALQVTEQQFMRLVGNSNQIAQIYVYPFSVPGLPRSPETIAYIDEYYTTFEHLQREGLDALIITGANVSNPRLELEPFWGPLTEVMEWAAERVTSVLCSCLATHSLMKYIYKIDRQLLPQKQWGVYEHRVARPEHPLLWDINTRFDVPHSRYNTITRDQFESAGLTILIESAEAGVHMAVSPDLFRNIYLQGHPEYHTNSLLKEYKREVLRYLNDERDLPPYPERYLLPEAQAIADAYIASAEVARRAGKAIPEFPEDMILPYLDNTWNDTGKAIFNNWLGLVYRLTHVDRDKLFMPGVDPENPLGLL